ncbi:MAG: phosphoenolpyruvate--protein phosphotransferase [Oscillospiraceae bacterium]|nr:phosphoenolpyruvate--protein phosphotransferase [Oscillospiraceae bacterium]
MLLKGVGASAGAAIAHIFYIKQLDLSVERQEGRDPEAETSRFESAKAQAFSELDKLFEKTAVNDSAAAQVFDIHKLMLDDPDFCDGVEAAIGSGLNAEYAVKTSADALIDFLGTLENEVMRGRAADVRDVSERLIRILKGIEERDDTPSEEVIVLAEDLLPSQTVRLDREKVSGFVTKRGSVTSHSVILAKTMGIPCIVGMGDSFDELPESGELAIDGSTGEVLVSPSESEREDFLHRVESFRLQKEALEKYRDITAVTPKGHEVKVCANIGGVADADAANAFGAGGVGLFRSEFLYLESPGFPSEEKQFAAYKAVLEKLSPRPVVIRTLDLGSDKQAPYFNIPEEENPALGYRAIRICLKEPQIFRTQLRALLRASVYGKLQVMFPMITHLGQVLEIREIVSKIKSELDSEGLPYSRDVEFGIMVETPAAAVMSDELAKVVDFFSIGTNDLTQYTMAADRMNSRIRDIFNPADPAVLRFIEMTAKAAHANGIWVGICGESAADTALTDFYMSIGIDELSVSPASIPEVKKAVLSSNG